ncbi:MAG TPA: DUF1592 domain-containing protein [Polyangiaceae bacterium]
MRVALFIAMAAGASLGCSGAIEGAPSNGSGAASNTGGSTVASGGSSTSYGGGGPKGSAGTNPGGGSSNANTGGTGGTGSAQGGSAGTTPTPAACASAAPDAGESVLRRLSNLEYQRTLQALFQLTAPPDLEGLPGDSLKDGFELAETQTVSALHLRGYLDKATALADEVLAKPERRTAIIGCDVAEASCLESFVGSFGRLAYRRPLEPAEIQAITAGAAEHQSDAADGFRYAMQVLLTSPSFLFRVEVGDMQEGLSTLTPSEVASRLSFALTGRGPSAALLDQAASGGLDTADGLAAAAAGLLEGTASHDFFGAFFRRWLGYDVLRAPVPAPSDWNDALLADMQSETDRVLSDFAWTDRNFLEVLTTSSTRLTPALATYYGLGAPAADGALTIPSTDVRAGTGLLTHAGLLSAKRDGDLIAIRGNWVRNAFLCEQLGAVDLTEVTEDLVGLTRIEIVKLRNMRPECTGCHAQIDPIGVGFAEFDATGRYDDSLDASVYEVATAVPDFDDGAFSTIAELSQKLAGHPAVSACFTEKAFLFVNGREPGAADGCTVTQASESFAADNHAFQGLLSSLVTSPAFRLRRAPAGSE